MRNKNTILDVKLLKVARESRRLASTIGISFRQGHMTKNKRKTNLERIEAQLFKVKASISSLRMDADYLYGLQLTK